MCGLCLRRGSVGSEKISNTKASRTYHKRRAIQRPTARFYYYHTTIAPTQDFINPGEIRGFCVGAAKSGGWRRAAQASDDTET